MWFKKGLPIFTVILAFQLLGCDDNGVQIANHQNIESLADHFLSVSVILVKPRISPDYSLDFEIAFTLYNPTADTLNGLMIQKIDLIQASDGSKICSPLVTAYRHIGGQQPRWDGTIDALGTTTIVLRPLTTWTTPESDLCGTMAWIVVHLTTSSGQHRLLITDAFELDCY